MLDSAMQAALQQQVTQERQNAAAYLALSNKADILVLPGLAKFFAQSSHEETGHAERFSAYLIDRNVEPATGNVNAFAAPDCDMTTAGAVLLTLALQLEQANTARINTLLSLAMNGYDFQTFNALQWAIDEQTRSERELMDMIAQWTFAQGCAAAILQLDHELGEGEQ